MPTDPTLQNDFSIAQVSLNSQLEAQDFASRIVSNASGGRSNLIQTIRKYKDNAAAPKSLRFPVNETAKYYMTLQIADYARTDLFNINFDTKSTITLPLPAQMMEHSSVGYDVAEVGLLTGTAINAAAPGISSALKNMPTNQQDITDLMNSLRQAESQASSGPETGAGPAGANPFNLPKGLTNTLAAGAIDAASIDPYLLRAGQALAGYSPNQFYTVLLRGPDYNNYAFSWRLFPKNFQESLAIKNIYYALQNAKAPTAALGGALWKFPSIFRLAYFPNSNFLNKFKPAVLEDVQFNFAPGGSPSFYASNSNENAPEAVEMTLRFKELEYWLGSDYIDNNGPYDTTGGARGV